MTTRYTLIVWLISLSCVMCFVLRDQFHPNTIKSSPKLFDLMDQYISMHGAETVLAEKSTVGICERKFIVGTYACPQAIGNHMHEFTNSFAGAFITNRTLVWKYCVRKACLLDNEDDCHLVTDRHPWMMSVQDLHRRWEEDKCEHKQPQGVIHQLIPGKFRFQSEQILLCCGLDTNIFDVSRMDFGTFDLHEFYSLSLPVARLNPDSKERARELFRLGEDFGYGVLFRATFRIKSFLTTPNDEMIAAHERKLYALYNSNNNNKEGGVGGSGGEHNRVVIVRPFYIGLHIRHSSDDKEDRMSPFGINCVKQTYRDFLHHKHNRTQLSLTTHGYIESVPNAEPASDDSMCCSEGTVGAEADSVIYSQHPSSSRVSNIDHQPTVARVTTETPAPTEASFGIYTPDEHIPLSGFPHQLILNENKLPLTYDRALVNLTTDGRHKTQRKQNTVEVATATKRQLFASATSTSTTSVITGPGGGGGGGGGGMKHHHKNSHSKGGHRKVKVVYPCVLLLASDREHEVNLWLNESTANPANLMNCTVLTTNHTKSHVAFSEHGPFSGEIAMQDLDLLGRSDVLLGSSYAVPNLRNIVSTFSMLMAELRATNGRKYSTTIKSRFLPNCDNVIGARHQPHEVYQGVDYQCKDSKHIMLPMECPYWNKTSLMV